MKRIFCPNIFGIINHHTLVICKGTVPSPTDFRRHILQIIFLRAHTVRHPLVSVVVAALCVFLKNIHSFAAERLAQILNRNLQGSFRVRCQHGGPQRLVDQRLLVLIIADDLILLGICADINGNLNTQPSPVQLYQGVLHQCMPVVDGIVIPPLFKLPWDKFPVITDLARRGGILQHLVTLFPSGLFQRGESAD